MADAIATIERWIGEGRREYVCVTGVHGVMECRRDPMLRKIHNEAGIVAPDGVPLVYFLRLTGKKRTERVYGPDLMREVMAFRLVGQSKGGGHAADGALS